MYKVIFNWLKAQKKRRWVLFLDQIIFRFNNDKVSSIGSQLTYYLVLSIFPFIIFLLNIVKFTPLASADILNSLTRVLPTATQEMILAIINEIVSSSSNTLLSVSAIVGLWTSSTGISQVIRAVNEAYDAKEGRGFLRLRLVSLFFTFSLIVLIILVFVFLVFGEIIARGVLNYFNEAELFQVLWPIFRISIALGFMVLGFSLLYKYGPSCSKQNKLTFQDVLPGAVFVTVGWTLASMAFSFYVNNFGKYSVTYGSLGGIIVFLIWLYITSIIIVLGGEVNATLTFFKKNDWQHDPRKSIIDK
ncbi:YihY/virulence factor BrkB family protein [Desulfonispora thiosulfatigenes]|nr:YihY/virulence factor BrkB family protein [Desulfonispora thiosulfatigenes]